ncbi:hypothetical protein [Nocardia noduli]|uniref:hypothetical protein n=1 Tax=Nocardia noduli TaxID=2815722 RepID=UPI001C248D6C|nr:hypothetical protein [Nocardia noduli]
MSTTETHPGEDVVEQHFSLVSSMTAQRGRLLTLLVGPTAMLAPHHKEPIDEAARKLDFAVYELAHGRNVEASHTRYRESRVALEAAVTEAGMCNWSLNTLRAMLTDYLREAEFLASLAPAVLAD